MDRQMVYLCLMAFVSSCRSAPETFVVLVGSPVSVQRGMTATLPCWLAPSQNAEDLELRWYRGSYQHDTPVMLYKSKKFDHKSQKSSYAGRVDFSLKDPASGGLKTGDVSLKLRNVTIEDAGNYTCLVSSLKDFERSSVSLHVTETGTTPFLSVAWKNDNEVNVSCESEGWYPQPELRWSDKNKKDVVTDNLVYAKDPTGLFSVHSWLLLPNSFEVSCFVGLSKKETKMARMHLGSPQRSLQEESGSSSAGWVAFWILLALALASLAVAVAAALYFKKRAPQPRGDQIDGVKPTNNSEENEALLPKVMEKPTALSEASKFYVNVKLVDTNNPLLVIKESKLRDGGQMFSDEDRVTCLTAVRGTPGFTSGRHYWEVSLSSPNVEPKKSWWIGVTNRSEIPYDKGFSANTSNSFWFLSSSPDRGETVQFSSEPEVFLPVRSTLKKVGVYLNYEDGELSFYNVEDESLIGSLAAKFTKEVFPVFNPGKGDRGPMEILQKAENPTIVDIENAK